MSSTDRVGNEVKHRVEKARNVLRKVNRRQAKLIGYILRRNRLLKHGTEGKKNGRYEATGRRERRR
jgi:hypothetical protein